jgi:hypothetical protein
MPSRCGRRFAMLTDGHPLLSTLFSREFLGASECADTLSRVNRLSDRWTMRGGYGFFTLGVASYLDAAELRDTYLAAAALTNPILSDVFGHIYSGLRVFLQEVLDESVTYDERLPLPGFHIFQFDGSEVADEMLAERAHFDLQFLLAVPQWTPEATLSFTLPLGLPSGGGGLAVWPVRHEEILGYDLPARDIAAQSRCEIVDYEIGRMVLHDGFLLHAIGAPAGSAPYGQRITLQGHGVRHEGQWTIYW